LEHPYNKIEKYFAFCDLSLTFEQTTENGYQYQYQGQERQDELGLNWDSFKWRNYDYAIGRFINIDPLAEKYSYNGVYNFSENRVIDGRELEGLEWKRINDGGKAISDGVANKINSKILSSTNSHQNKQDNSIQETETTLQIANGIKDVGIGSGKLLGESLENVGDAGTGAALITGQVEALPVTETISDTGVVINAAIDYMSGESSTSSIITDLAINFAFNKLGDEAVKATEKFAGEQAVKNGENTVSEIIAKGVVEVWEKIVDFVKTTEFQ
jgi:RHS repeat-associated protein